LSGHYAVEFNPIRRRARRASSDVRTPRPDDLEHRALRNIAQRFDNAQRGRIVRQEVLAEFGLSLALPAFSHDLWHVTLF